MAEDGMRSAAALSSGSRSSAIGQLLCLADSCYQLRAMRSVSGRDAADDSRKSKL